MNQSYIQHAYDQIRPFITDGCLFLSSKDAFVSKTIRRHDRNEDGSWAEFSHIGQLFTKGDGHRKRVFTVDSNAPGVKPAFFSDRLKSLDNFMILKPLCSKELIAEAMAESFDRAKSRIKYDWINGLKEMGNRRYGMHNKIKPNTRRDICSDWVSIQAVKQNMMLPEFDSLAQPFPQDYYRYIDPNNVEFLRATDYANI